MAFELVLHEVWSKQLPQNSMKLPVSVINNGRNPQKSTANFASERCIQERGVLYKDPACASRQSTAHDMPRQEIYSKKKTRKEWTLPQKLSQRTRTFQCSECQE